MTTPASVPSVTDRDQYPLHEEDDVPEIPPHERLVRYLRDAIAARMPGAFVGGNACLYWERGNTRRYIAPDVFVVPNWQPPANLRVYLGWEDPPIVFVAEVVSRATAAQDIEAKPEVYTRHFQVGEYLRCDLDHETLCLGRLGPNGYDEVAPEANGRLRSETLELEFGLDAEGLLWVYTLDGERLRTYEEAEQQLEEVSSRLVVEAHRREQAETVAAEEVRQRELETRLRQAAEARAAAEAAQRAELERQLAELRAQLADRDGE
jgi:Uma2 family endonuclease